jgi:hypothetical protein
MRKLFFILIIIMPLGSCKKTDAKIQNTQGPDIRMEETKRADVPVFQRNPLYVNYRYEFEKLNDDEILTYKCEGRATNEYFFTVYKEENLIESISDSENDLYIFYAKNIKTGEKRQIGGKWKSSWGGYQFSIDRKTVIFSLLTDTYTEPMFKIDGRLGTITYLMDLNASARSTNKLEYILCSVYSEKVNDISKENKFALIDLEKIEVVRLLEWNITPLRAGFADILRSLDDNYDFKLDYGVESNTYAIAYYNIEKNILDTVFDVTEYKESAWEYAKETEGRSDMEMGFDEGEK